MKDTYKDGYRNAGDRYGKANERSGAAGGRHAASDRYATGDRYDYSQYDYVDPADARGGGSGFLTGALTGAVLASAITWLLDPQAGSQRRTMVRERASTAYERSRSGLGSARERARGFATQGRERIQRLRTRATGAGGVDTGSMGAQGLHARAGDTGSASAMGGDSGSMAGGFGAAGGMGGESRGEGGSQAWMQQAQQMLRGGGRTSQFATGAAGLGLAGYGLSRRGPLGLALGALGLYLVATAARQKSGEAVSSGIEIENEIVVDRPIHEVWEYVRRIDTWPTFMQHVEEITTSGDRISHWRVEGPAGIPAEWDAETTEEVPNERICWRTLPGSMVESEGELSLENDGSGGTRVRLWMIYSPPAGAAGHVVAKLFRRDPQTESTHDLQNLKQAIESGQAGAAASGTGSATGASPLSGSSYSSTH
jgi:uncharacterized membrane protein